MNFWIMKEDENGCYMGLYNPLCGSTLHSRDKYGPYVKSEDMNMIVAERDCLAAENAELRRRLDAIVAIFSHDEDNQYNSIGRYQLYDIALAIAEGRDNG